MTDQPLPARLIAIVPAAGVGARAGVRAGVADGLPKQYHLLDGVAMLRRAVQALLAEPRIAQVRVAVAADDDRADTVLAGLPRTVCRPCGGPTRADTVLAAVREVCHAGLEAHDWILVHDAARPGLPPDALARLIDACLADAALNDGVGGLLALPLADTLKRGDAGQRVQHTLARDGLWLAQTPQLFRAGLLRAALEAAQEQGVSVTDEASAMEAAGHAPLLVPGSMRNLKLTWPEDFALMEKWL